MIHAAAAEPGGRAAHSRPRRARMTTAVSSSWVDYCPSPGQVGLRQQTGERRFASGSLNGAPPGATEPELSAAGPLQLKR